MWPHQAHPQSKIDLLKDASGAGVLLHLTASSSTKGDRPAIAYTKPYQGQRKGEPPRTGGTSGTTWPRGLAGPVKQWFDREGRRQLRLHQRWRLPAGRDHPRRDMRMLPGWHLNWDTRPHQGQRRPVRTGGGR